MRRSLLLEDPPADYDRKFIAFLDILGFAERVKRSGEHADAALHRAMWSAGTQEELGPVAGVETTVFSDSILMSGDSLPDLLSIVSELWKVYARVGFFLRGGVALGQAIHRGRVAYGPAVVSAYRLEADVSQWPRVVIDPAISPAIDMVNGAAREIFARVIKMDVDGIERLDTFANFSHVEGKYVPDWLVGTRPQIERGLLESGSNPDVLAKYRWLGLRFNEFVEAENFDFQIARIKI